MIVNPTKVIIHIFDMSFDMSKKNFDTIGI